MLVLILAWGFGGFMEAVAGFGTAVAIPAFLSPFIIVWLTGKSQNGKNAFKDMLGFTLLAALSYVLPALAVAQFVGAEFVDLAGNTISLVLMVIAARMRKPTADPDYIVDFSENTAGADGSASSAKKPSFGVVTAWMPYILMLLFLILSSKLVAPVNAFLAQFTSKVVLYSGEGGATVSLAWIGNGGVMIFLAGVIGGLIQKASIGTIGKVLADTCKSMWKAIATIIFIIAVAKVMGYSGMTASIATLLASLTGSMFPLFAPIVGIIGTFVTGSTTSSGILFAKMQAEVAQQIGANAVQLVAANMAGGAIGKLISPQSIAVAIAAIGLEGADGKIMSQTVKYCIAFGVIVCAFSYITAVLI